MPDRARLARAKVANVIALVVIIVLTGSLIATEAARRRHQEQAREYAALLTRERFKVRTCMSRRLDSLESRILSIPNKDKNRAYQARLADVRQQFARVMRGPVAPVPSPAKPVPVPTASTPARVDEPACPFSEEEAVNARATAQQLAALQAWVRDNLGVVK